MRNGIVMLVLVAATAALLYALIQPSQPTSKSYSDFESDVKAGSVMTVVRQDTTLTVTKNDTNKTTYTVQSDSPASGESAVIESWNPSGPKIDYTVQKPADTGWIVLIATTLVPVVIVVLFIAFFMRQAQGTNNQALSFGKSRARMFLGN
jgi:cell division protease FtsH